MSKIILVNGSCHEKGNTYIALREVADELEKRNIETEMVWLGTKAYQDCVACRNCSETGRCAFGSDEVNEVLEAMESADGIVVGSPVYYGGPSGRLCSFLDRLFYASSGRFTGKTGAAVVVCRRGGATASFDRLNNYFLMNNMVVASSQYWNQVHGASQGEAKEDAEGLQTMRTLAANIAWIVNNTKDADKPSYEKRIATNFIR